MPKLDFAAFEKRLREFDFPRLFVDVLGWNQPAANRSWQPQSAGETAYQHRAVAELGGVVALQVVADGGWPDENQRQRIWRQLSRDHAENVLIFTDDAVRAAKSQWYWVRRDKHPETGKPRQTPRRHDYFRGQAVDLFASKLQAMVVELSDLDVTGRLSVLEAAHRIEAALDVETTTRKFYEAYKNKHLELLDHIHGIADVRDRRWYASVLLNRLMFVWFLQKKRFLDGGDTDYLRRKLNDSKQRGHNRFFSEFLSALFFEAFAKPPADRAAQATGLTGKIPFLNGGLFLHHKLELDEHHAPRIGRDLHVADAAFDSVFELFSSYSWHLDDTPGGQADEINPDVLGYIFEKYINQKAFGAYYTPPEITGYLAERSIHKLILERVHEPALPELGLQEIAFDSVPDMLAKMDARTALKLVRQVLPGITVLDPAVGSGAFLIAALKALLNVYSAIVGRAEVVADGELQNWLRGIRKDHPSVGYYIKRRIVTDNLYGVDLMEEACEIAKLRLFLSMVASVRNADELEPLPNIDFNILSGNALFGLMRVDEHEFDARNRQSDMFRKSFRQLVNEKNRALDVYRHNTDMPHAKDVNLRGLRDNIDTTMAEAGDVLDELLQDQFAARGIKFEQAAWDGKKKALGKAVKRAVTKPDLKAQRPFHWGYVFHDTMHKDGGFDIIATNPPWEVFKPQTKEFFEIAKNKTSVEEFERHQAEVLSKEPKLREEWLAYESSFPHMNAWYRTASEYRHQTAIVGGRKAQTDLNLYKLFLERCFHLLRPGGHCGIVIPSGIYTDLGAKGLRDLLFERTKVEGLFCFENRKTIFEGVHRSFKFVVLTFEKSGGARLLQPGERNASAPPADLLAEQVTKTGGTTGFPAAFMRHDVKELARFPDEGAIWIDLDLVRRLSPESHSVMEFKSAVDLAIARKLTEFPFLSDETASWRLELHRELHMTDDEPSFRPAAVSGTLPLAEGKMIHQFEFGRQAYKHWIPEQLGRKSLLGREADTEQILSYQRFRLAHRSIGRSTDERTMIATMLPPNVFSGHSLNVAFRPVAMECQLYLLAVLNSFVFDYYLRQQVSANLTIFFIYQCCVPRVPLNRGLGRRTVELSAQLVCTSAPFEALAEAVNVQPNQNASDQGARSKMRSSIEGIVAHLYGLTDVEFAHVLESFPLVPDPRKVAALNALRDVEKGLLR